MITYLPGFSIKRTVTSRGPPGGLNFSSGSWSPKNPESNGVGSVFGSNLVIYGEIIITHNFGIKNGLTID